MLRLVIAHNLHEWRYSSPGRVGGPIAGRQGFWPGGLTFANAFNVTGFGGRVKGCWCVNPFSYPAWRVWESVRRHSVPAVFRIADSPRSHPRPQPPWPRLDSRAWSLFA